MGPTVNPNAGHDGVLMENAGTGIVRLTKVQGVPKKNASKIVFVPKILGSKIFWPRFF